MRKAFDFTKLAFWIGLLLVIYIFAILINESGKNYQLRQKADSLDADIAKLQSDIESLGYKVSYYQTDLYKEKLAREKLGLQKPGEQVIIIRDDGKDSATSSSDTASSTSADGRSNLAQWLDFLFGGRWGVLFLRDSLTECK